MQFKAIEILYHHLNAPAIPPDQLVNFNFTVNLETKADASNKLVFIILTVEIKNEEQTHLFSSMAASCIYFVENFAEVVTISADGKIDIDKGINDVVCSASISTVRGILFCYLKGTFLHGAILPIIDLGKLERR